MKREFLKEVWTSYQRAADDIGETKQLINHWRDEVPERKVFKCLRAAIDRYERIGRAINREVEAYTNKMGE